MNSLNFLVFGDSIIWGQGLKEEHKLHSMIANAIVARTKGITVNKYVFAHSGACLGDPNSADANIVVDPITDYSGEVPSPSPTVAQQIAGSLSYLDGQSIDHESINLILIDGGINDLQNGADQSFTVLLDPTTGSSLIKSQSQTICHDNMNAILTTLLDSFPNAFIFVTGYYQIVSGQTDLTGLEVAMGVIGGQVAGFLGFVVGLVTGAIVTGDIVSNCKLFASESGSALQQAVIDVRQLQGGSFRDSGLPRVFFIDPRGPDPQSQFGEANALFAGGDNGDDKDKNTQSFLWGFTPSIDTLAATIAGGAVAGGDLGCAAGALVGSIFGPVGAALGCAVGDVVGTGAGTYEAVQAAINEVQPVDEVVSERERFCDFSDILNRCASVGHPNIQGEKAYLAPIIQHIDAILPMLLPSGLPWLSLLLD